MSSQPKADTPNNKPQKGKKQRKTPRKITASYLRNSGLYYLQRFTASSGHFRTVMLRKIRKSCNHHKDQNFEDCAKLLDKTIEDFITEGLLDDAGYVRGMVTSLRRSGKSARAIHAKLMAKSVPADAIESALKTYDEDNFEDPSDAEFLSALKFARKKRLGLFDTTQKHEPDKAIAALARQGFQYDTCRKIMELQPTDIETLPQEAQSLIYSTLSFTES